MLLAKAIDGIYDSDPKVNPQAKKYDEISIQEIIDKKLMAVDLTASIMCWRTRCLCLYSAERREQYCGDDDRNLYRNESNCIIIREEK